MATFGEKAVVLDYTAITDAQKDRARELKVLAAAYLDAIDAAEKEFGPQRDYSIAKTKVQEASMWVTRGLTNPERK